MRFSIDTPQGIPDQHVVTTPAAQEAIRMNFNPSGIVNVERLKALAAAFISECDRQMNEGHQAAGREYAVAKTNMQTASMWAVLAATKGLP